MRRARTDLPQLLDGLYAGLLDDEAWKRALGTVCDRFGANSLALFSVDPRCNRVYRADVLRNDPAAMTDYQQNWIHLDPRHAAGLTCEVGEPQTERMLTDVRELRRLPIHHEFLRRWNIPYFMATWITRHPRRGVVMTLLHDAHGGEFDEHDRDAMRFLVPHVRRILEIKDRLQHAQSTSRGLLECIDRMPFGTLLLDANLRVLEASASARRLLSLRDGIHADGGTLGFTRGAEAAAFAAVLTRNGLLERDLDCVQVRRAPPLPPLALVTVPLPASGQSWLGVEAQWMVAIFDPDRDVDPDQLLLRTALNVTTAEAALARLLARGHTLTEAARLLGVTRNTARSQLKSIYAKTGVSTQAQLVRRIFTSPALLGRLHPNG